MMDGLGMDGWVGDDGWMGKGRDMYGGGGGWTWYAEGE